MDQAEYGKLALKLKSLNKLDAEGNEHIRDLIYAVDDGKEHRVKLTSNLPKWERDEQDQRYFKRVSRTKMVFKKRSGGCIILFGNLGCGYYSPFGGEFFVTNAIEDEKNFDDINGVDAVVEFCNKPSSIEATREFLKKLECDSRFVYNLAQFDEIVELFKYYTQLSAAINNNESYEIRRCSDPYRFAAVNEKNIRVDTASAICDTDGIVVGYKLKEYEYEELFDDAKDRIRDVFDITVDANETAIKKIRRFAQNLYLGKNDKISEADMKLVCPFTLICIRKADNGKGLILTGEVKKNGKRGDYKYLHLYDMGQKIKLESINRSLQLINQGETGCAAELLEYIIGDKIMPNKRVKRKKGDNKDKYIEGLDDSQKAAFLMATDSSPVSLIKGPPGTGKTHVINAIVQYITRELGERVVISSQTHVAIDNVLDKLMENYDLIIPNRITNRRNRYSGTEIDETLYKTWAKKFDGHNKRSRDVALAEKIAADMEHFNGDKLLRFSRYAEDADYKVLGATTTTSALGGKRGSELLDGYDWLIIDEVSKCPITEVLRYLPYVKKIIMVGDDYQLAPLLEFNKEDVEKLSCYDPDKFDRLKAMYEQSVFAKTLEKAESAKRLVTLNNNYRSTAAVLGTYNVFYDDGLVNRRDKTDAKKVAISDPLYNESDVFFIDVKGGREANAADGKSRYNVEELAATAAVLKDLIENVKDASTVSVSAIFPYAAQIDKFQKENRDLINKGKTTFKSFEIDTVDAFQGRETDIVLVNTVVTDETRRNFLSEFRRINVSVSRARDKLFLFGNRATLSKIKMALPNGGNRYFLKEIIDHIRRHGKIIEYKGGIDRESVGKFKNEVD